MMSGVVQTGKPRGRPRKDGVRQLVQFGNNSTTNPQAYHQDLRVGGELHEEDVECPQMEDEDEMMVKKKEIKRSWRDEWKSQHKWVYPIKKDGGELRLKCHWCTSYNMDNVFAKEGCSTIQLSALNTHAKSEAHKTAESRWESSDNGLAQLHMPDGLWDLGGKNGEMAVDGGEAGEGLDDGDLTVGVGGNGGGGGGIGRKRKMASAVATSMGMPLIKSSCSSSSESLGCILQKNNSRVVEAMVEAEAGRNKRHAADAVLMRKQLTQEEQRLRIEEQRMQFEKMKWDHMVALGQQYNNALAVIGDGLIKIGVALEQCKKQ